ncbi:MAG: hypothetical protein ABI723_18775 [Bacteroidia bacterium]
MKSKELREIIRKEINKVLIKEKLIQGNNGSIEKTKAKKKAEGKKEHPLKKSKPTSAKKAGKKPVKESK